MSASNLPRSKIFSFPLLADLPPEEAATLEALFEEKQLVQGKDVYREGEPSRYFYFLLSGTISLWHRRGSKEEQARLLSPGEVFGEEALLGIPGRNATAYVEKEATVLRASSESLRLQLRFLPAAGEILRTVARGRRLVRSKAFPWLEPDESVFLATRKSNMLLFPGLAGPIALGLISLASIFFIHMRDWPEWAYTVSAAGMILALAYGIWSAVDWGNDYYLITNRRVVAIHRVPLVYDDRQEAPLSMIQSVSVSSTISQRPFGYGDVVVQTFTRPIIFESIPRPAAAARMLEQIRKREQRAEERSDREEIQRMLAQRLKGGEAAELRREETGPSVEGDASAPDSVSPAGALGAMQTRHDSGDVITYRKHRFFLFRNLFLPGLLAVFGLTIGVLNSEGFFPIDRPSGLAIAAGVLLAGAVWGIYEYADWANDLYQVTSSQILAMHRKPLGDEERRSAVLENILSLEYDRPSFLARMLDFGTVKATVGQVSFTFDEVSDPIHVQEDIFRRMEAKKKLLSQSQHLRRREEIADWIETYHKITRPEDGGDKEKE
jgi:CRP-like cAMP-binding protein